MERPITHSARRAGKRPGSITTSSLTICRPATEPYRFPIVAYGAIEILVWPATDWDRMAPDERPEGTLPFPNGWRWKAIPHEPGLITPRG